MPGKQKTSASSTEDQVLDSNSDELENEADGQDEGSEGTEAQSSSADDSKSSEDERKDLLDVVKDAVQKEDDKKSDDEDDEDDKKEQKPQGKSKEDASSASKDGKSDEDDASAEFTEEELKSLKPSTQKRIRALNGKLEDAHAQVEEYKPHAESYRKIDGFMRQYGITPEESAEAFTIMALVKTDPGQALQRMRQHINNIASYVGEELPADLKQKVEDGTLDEETAKELSKARATAKIERDRREASEKTNKKRDDERTAADRNASLAGALDNWQATIAQSDPDYQKKHGFLKTQLQALIAELGTPDNADEMVRYANIAYGMVNKQIGQVIPQDTGKKREKRSIQSRNASGPSPKPKPETTLDVVRQAVGK